MQKVFEDGMKIGFLQTELEYADAQKAFPDEPSDPKPAKGKKGAKS